MFAKPGVASKPVPAVLQRFQEKAAEAGQTNFRTFGKPPESSSSSPPAKTFGRPAVEPKTSSGPPSASIKPKPHWGKDPPTQTPWRAKTEKNTDQNQNVTDVSFKKRGSLTIPNAFQKTNSTAPSTERKISIEEKPSVQNGSIPKPISPSSPTTPVSTIPSVKKDEDSKPKIDFRANLRPAATKGAGPPKQIEIHPRQRLPSKEEKPSLPPGNVGSTKSPPGSKASFSIPKRITPLKKIVTRSDDGKKFERVAKSTIITTELAPIKPLRPRDVSIGDIIEEFKDAYEKFKNTNEELYDDVGNFIIQDEQEEYDDVGNVSVDKRGSKRKSNRPVSEIPIMTEEEELGSGGSTSASASASGSGGSAAVLGNTQSELYDEGVPAESDELYEPLPDEEPEINTPVIDKKEQERREREAAEKKKREEKEQREREKKEKQEQARREREEKARLKERERKEKEERELKKKLKMTGDEQPEGQGVVREKSKGGKLDLAVQPGEKLDIIRMTNNPKGKWLVRNQDGSFGYVDSENIIIETPTIKQVMKLVDNPQAVGDDGQEEMYEDLDGYTENMEEIYEECS